VIILISICLSITLLIWSVVWLVEYWKTKNIWTFLPILIFLCAFILQNYGIYLFVFKSTLDGYFIWKFFNLFRYSLILSCVGLLIRSLLRLTNRIKIDKAPRNLWYI